VNLLFFRGENKIAERKELLTMSKYNGYELWRGKSLITGDAIVCIITGVSRKSSNIKTGPLLQVSFLCQEQNPLLANKTGLDKAICSGCKHRLMRTCYINLRTFPYNIYKAWKRNRYPKLDINDPVVMKNVFENHGVRLGAYGDPSSIPIQVLNRISSFAKFTLGYTHNWSRINPELNKYCMASCETEKESNKAKDMGYRVFLALQAGQKAPVGFINCPAASGKTTCIKCKSCSGQNGKNKNKSNIWITFHGPVWKKKYFTRGLKNIKNKKKYSLVPV